METRDSYTKEEVVTFTINLLSNITVPVALSEEIGLPVCRAIGKMGKSL